MTLDLQAIAPQIQEMLSLVSLEEDRHRFGRLQQAWDDLDDTEVNRRLDTAKSSFLLPVSGAAYRDHASLPPVPASYVVAGTDGSAIHPDRHSPARYYVINTGLVRLEYGDTPAASMYSEPVLFSGENQLVVPDSIHRIPVNTTIIGLRRTAAELVAASSLLKDVDQPAVALQDGTLILWGLESQPDAVIEWVLPEFVHALKLFEDRQQPVASYISAPGTQELVNTMRIAVCDYPLKGKPVNCDSCRSTRKPVCDVIPQVTDRYLFEEVAKLQPGERSAVFESSSKILQRYGSPELVICYFYLHTGIEVGRVEFPRWVADDQQHLDLVHAVVYDQCQLGRGYPVVLQEAHEQAVLSVADRRLLEDTIERALARRGIVVRHTGKDGSKRVRII